MNLPSFTARGPVIAAAGAAAAAALVLAGCGPSSSSATSGSGGGSGAAGGSTAASSSGSGSGSGSGASVVGGGSGGSTIFPVAVGNTWVYKTNLGSASGTGTSTNKMTAVTPTADGQRVTMLSQVKLPGSTAPASSVAETLVFHPDGSISVPLTQAGGSVVTIKSGSVVWPSAAGLASGQSRASTLVMSVAEAGTKLTVKEHVVVRGDGTASVTVPAGTYQTTVIQEEETSKVDGIAVDLEIKTWVANGVGPVKSEVISTDAGRTTVTSEQELVSFHKG